MKRLPDGWYRVLLVENEPHAVYKVIGGALDGAYERHVEPVALPALTHYAVRIEGGEVRFLPESLLTTD